MKKYIFAFYLVFGLFTACTEAERNQLKQQASQEEQVDSFKILKKTETVGTHYQFFSLDKYNHTRVRTEYNVIARNARTSEVFVFKDIDIEDYYSFDVNKTYAISKHKLILLNYRKIDTSTNKK